MGDGPAPLEQMQQTWPWAAPHVDAGGRGCTEFLAGPVRIEEPQGVEVDHPVTLP
jgi:hypothetical protein